jgi:GT2 family glycosyltransferase
MFDEPLRCCSIESFEGGEMNVSVIIPTHLSFSKTQQLVNSCIKQLHEDDDLIVVIDQPKHVRGYKDIKARNVKIIVNEKNIGCAASRNRGIQQANKEVIIFLDSGSVFPDDLIDSHRNAHLKFDEEIVVAGQTHFNEIGV